MGDRDGHVLVHDGVEDRDLVRRVHDLRAAAVPVVVADLGQLLDDDPVDARGAGQDVLQVRDQDADLAQLVHDLLPLEAGEALQLQVQDRLGLQLGEGEGRHQALAGVVRGAGGADEGDHRVQVVEGDGEALEDVGAGLRLAQLEGGAPPHHLAPEVDEQLAGLEDVQHPRPLVDDGQHDDPEGVLQLGVLVQVVQDDRRRLALLHVHHDAHPVAVALVADVGDALPAACRAPARPSSR